MTDLPYPSDGGLKPQARPIDETLSMDEVFRRERIRQQQDPSHDQGAFIPVDRTAEADRFKYFAPDPFPTMPDDDEREVVPYRFAHVIEGVAGGSGGVAGQVSVCGGAGGTASGGEGTQFESGFFTVGGGIGGGGGFFDHAQYDQKVRDAGEHRLVLNYEPKWVQELMWTIHNLFAHPISEILYWSGVIFPPARWLGEWLHDSTVPLHEPNTGRG